MNEETPIDPGDFQQKIYRDLDEKLRSSAWQSGASEAHGLLTGLACRGVGSTEIANKMHLLQITDSNHVALLQGLFELVLRELESPEPVFNLLLPDGSATNRELAEDLSGWCQGFMQGIYNDGIASIADSSEAVHEIVDDMINIGNMDLSSIDDGKNDDERSLSEIEEYLRVGIQLIYDELKNPTRPVEPTGQPKIH